MPHFNKEHVRALLRQANVEINAALSRVDVMGTHELAEMTGLAETVGVFSSRQSICGSHSAAGLISMPEFNTNNGCGTAIAGSDDLRGLQLVRALRSILR